ncbi:hypothetical protein AKJ09_03377 [Labilithrix luteola]|uniref:Uncharacterized protein n=1 Tax=Labilithrix luteola TaxID=1391654 RepID=A0A0K1PT60_9BACT|nr:hypothetical protein AKJ09_03377 [Labilithrix luteola]
MRQRAVGAPEEAMAHGLRRRFDWLERATRARFTDEPPRR